jgi:hypothetical protein
MLLEHCKAEQIRCIPFESFATVRTVIEHYLTPASQRPSIRVAESRIRRQLAESNES